MPKQPAELYLPGFRSNEHWPHETLGGRTPNEVYFGRSPANNQPRLEPRRSWPRGSPCIAPRVDVDGNPGDPIILTIDYPEDRSHLPIIAQGTLRNAQSNPSCRETLTPPLALNAAYPFFATSPDKRSRPWAGFRLPFPGGRSCTRSTTKVTGPLHLFLTVESALSILVKE